MRRSWQQGYIYQKNNPRKWDENAPAYLQYWRDIPGQERQRETAPLGICRTRTVATRRAAEQLECLGINSTQQLSEAISNASFQMQAERWLKSLANRKRNPLEQTTIDTRRYALNKWICPFFAGRPLADINNRAMKELVEDMVPKLSPATIRDYTGIVRDVVASAINEDGEELFSRTWNEEFIDAPAIDKQRQPSATSEGITDIVKSAKGQYQMLYALLAGCGPMRAGEALGLEIDKHISRDFRTLHILQKAKRGKIQPFLKTKNGERDVDLCVLLAAMLRDFIGTRTHGLLFCTSTGGQLLQANTLQDSLHPILKKLHHEKGGFNIFRRFRITYLNNSDCPEKLQHFWSGHAQTHVSERYLKLMKDREYRLEWAEQLGTGFTLPSQVGILGIPVLVRRRA